MDLNKIVENVTVADQIIEVLNAICEKLGVVIDWTSQNVVPYLLELVDKMVKYRLFKSWIYLILFSIIFVVIAVVFKKSFIRIDYDKDGNVKKTTKLTLLNYLDYVDGVFVFVLAVIWILDIIFIIVNILNIGECYYFPEKAALDYIRSFYKYYELFR